MFFKIIRYKIKKRKKINPIWKKHSINAKNKVSKIITDIHTKYNGEIYFEFNRISIRNQKTRWGSCSSNKNLNFNYKIVFLPDYLAEYIVIHELCHLKHFNHSKEFWELVKFFCPEYAKFQTELKSFKFTKEILSQT